MQQIFPIALQYEIIRGEIVRIEGYLLKMHKVRGTELSFLLLAPSPLIVDVTDRQRQIDGHNKGTLGLPV